MYRILLVIKGRMKSGHLKQELETETREECCIPTHLQTLSYIFIHTRTAYTGDGTTHSGLGIFHQLTIITILPHTFPQVNVV